MTIPDIDILIDKWQKAHEPHNVVGSTLADWLVICLLREILRRLDDAATRPL